MQVVLADWMMPWMDGLELCRRIRGLAGRPYTYFVLFTGRGGCEERLEALAAGVDDFLAKPFDTRELVARLEIARRLLSMQEDLERKNAALRELATTDELTGLKNRRSFFEALESHFALAARQRSPLSLVMLDVDRFKTYNDAFGHPAGDDVLRGIADVLRSTTRAHDTVARHGGEEFTVLLPVTGPVVARGMAERLRETIEQRDWPHRSVTASFGVASMTLKTGQGPGSGGSGRSCPLRFQTPRSQPRHPSRRSRRPPPRWGRAGERLREVSASVVPHGPPELHRRRRTADRSSSRPIRGGSRWIRADL